VSFDAPTVNERGVDQRRWSFLVPSEYVQYDSEANIKTSEMDMSHLISRCTAIAANDKSTRTIGIAVIVMPNSAD
jgi:hypothetical protein